MADVVAVAVAIPNAVILLTFLGWTPKTKKGRYIAGSLLAIEVDRLSAPVPVTHFDIDIHPVLALAIVSMMAVTLSRALRDPFDSYRAGCPPEISSTGLASRQQGRD